MFQSPVEDSCPTDYVTGFTLYTDGLMFQSPVEDSCPTDFLNEIKAKTSLRFQSPVEDSCPTD